MRGVIAAPVVIGVWDLSGHWELGNGHSPLVILKPVIYHAVMSPKHIFVLISTILAVSLAIIIYIFLSLWNLWFLLPDQGIRLAINQTKPGTPFIADYLTRLQPDIKPVLESSRRIAISINQDNITLAIVPRNFFKSQKISARLSQPGWSIRNYGLIIIANRGENSPSSFISSFIKSSRSVFSSNKPLQPALIFHVPPNSAANIDDTMYGLAVASTKSLSGQQAITLQMNNNSLQYNPELNSQYKSVDGLQLAIPGGALSSLPKNIQDQLQKQILLHLPFKKTNPDIVSLLARQKWLQININDENIAISLKGNIISVADQIITWSKLEEAYARPVKQAFRLPDRTLAYEEVPGQLQAIFQVAGNDCRGASWPALDTSKAGITGVNPSARVSIWLCRSGDTLTISNNQEWAQANLKIAAPAPADSWNMAIGAPWLPEIISSNIKSLSGQGSQNYHTITAILNP